MMALPRPDEVSILKTRTEGPLNLPQVCLYFCTKTAEKYMPNFFQLLKYL